MGKEVHVERARMHFLLVEDDDDHAHLVSCHLKRHRVRITVDRVANGAQALRYLRKEGEYADRQLPDVILLDLNLPKVHGHQVLRMIKEDEQLCRVPVVILTTSDAESDRAKAYEHHANSYLVKPMDFERFRNMVDVLDSYWSVWNRPVPPGSV